MLGFEDSLLGVGYPVQCSMFDHLQPYSIHREISGIVKCHQGTNPFTFMDSPERTPKRLWEKLQVLEHFFCPFLFVKKPTKARLISQKGRNKNYFSVDATTKSSQLLFFHCDKVYITYNLSVWLFIKITIHV